MEKAKQHRLLRQAYICCTVCTALGWHDEKIALGKWPEALASIKAKNCKIISINLMGTLI